MIASNKQRQEHNNLATIWRAKPKEAHETPRAYSLSWNPNANPKINGVGSS